MSASPSQHPLHETLAIMFGVGVHQHFFAPSDPVCGVKQASQQLASVQGPTEPCSMRDVGSEGQMLLQPETYAHMENVPLEWHPLRQLAFVALCRGLFSLRASNVAYF
jgi:hypothetical protein